MSRARNKTCPDCGTLILSNSKRCRSCATRLQFKGIPKASTKNMKGPKSPEHRKAISLALTGKTKTKEHLKNLRKSLLEIGQWKQIGSTYLHNGYRWIKTRNGNGSSNFVLEHRYIMAQHIGRLLSSNELVHHKNENKLDNRIENLELMTSNVHSHLHKPSEKTKKKMSDKRKAYWKKRHEIAPVSVGLVKFQPANCRQT